jgi:hypothetical protein
MNNIENKETMDNKDNMETTLKFINNTYDKLSYFDMYGNSVFIFIFVTLLVFLVYSYCQIMQKKGAISDDWVNQRCKPQNIPFAGFITHPDGKTPFQYTNENFQYCVQNILSNVSNYALEPFHFMIQSIMVIFNSMNTDIQNIREVVNKLRNNMNEFTAEVLNKFLNVIIPIQKIFIATMDTFNKIQGVLTTGLFTVLGSYYTLQSLMGSILELVIKVLISLVVIIIGLWVLPFTWPAAASMSAVFLAIAIPLSIIIVFMKDVLHIKSSKVPKLRCFDRKTKIYLYDNTFKFIEDVKIGDTCLDGSVITAKIKVTSEELDMYNLNGIIISGCHIIKYNNKWIPVREHPCSMRIHKYYEPYLYCLNTSTKTMVLNNITFTDWDEIYDDNLEFILKYKSIGTTNNISKILDKGFSKTTKINLLEGQTNMGNVQIGDVLSTRGVVYGIVELNNLGDNEKIYNLLVTNKYFELADETICPDYNNNIDSVLELKNLLSK